MQTNVINGIKSSQKEEGTQSGRRRTRINNSLYLLPCPLLYAVLGLERQGKVGQEF